MGAIDTTAWSRRYRERAVRVEERRLLITRFTGSEQEKDLKEPANCRGLGRVRHFQMGMEGGWPTNPLPIVPALEKLGAPIVPSIRAQVFQNAVCNWRCWYCFVDFKLLSGDVRYSEWMSAEELVELYLGQDDPPPMIDLTGGQPDLTPEWIPWMMDALEKRGLHESVYLWSDDNLSNDYFWRYLTNACRARVASYPMYGRVCCFKGYNENSFAFNTEAESAGFGDQFALFERLMATGIDLYAYVTFTTPSVEGLEEDMGRFVDGLQRISRALPLRVVPLEVRSFAPVRNRETAVRLKSMELQRRVVEQWQKELTARFSEAERTVRIDRVVLS